MEDGTQAKYTLENEPSVPAASRRSGFDLLQASRSLFDELDDHATLLGEVSNLSKRNHVNGSTGQLVSSLAMRSLKAPCSMAMGTRASKQGTSSSTVQNAFFPAP